MTDLFAMFDDEHSVAQAPPRPMSDPQRQILRDLFAALRISDAPSQFDIVEEMTGRRLRSVRDLDEDTARTIIIQMRHRVAAAGQSKTGDAWTDRTEDTWIDRL